MPQVPATEGEPFEVAASQQQALRSAVRDLERQLGTSGLLKEEAGRFTITGVVGTISVAPGVLVDVAPKIQPGDDWINSVLDLLTATDRVRIAGDRRAGLSQHRNLLDVLAGIYAHRLRTALRRDGPLLTMERQESTLPLLKGKLRTTAWVRRASWEPHLFPVAYQYLTADNGYARALAYVAQALARSTTVSRTRGMLLTDARALRPGFADVAHAPAGAALRGLPSQWAAYQPAWDIVVSVLSRRSLLGAIGSRFGVSIGIEPWPLLETLLKRSLDAAVHLSLQDGRMLDNPGRLAFELLAALPGSSYGSKRVEPDGLLYEAGEPVASFEAKYARRWAARWPAREHYFQALSTAAAIGSPLAILVYPESFEPVWWRVTGFDDAPKHLAAIGLGLFSYRRGTGDRERGRRIVDVLAGPVAPDSSAAHLVAS